MKLFTELFSQLDQTTSANLKVDALAEYFSKASGQDRLWALAILSDRRPTRIVNTTQLRIWATDICETPEWLFEESFQIVGDLAETVALVLPGPTKWSDKPISEWVDFIKSLRGLEEIEKRVRITEAWDQLDFKERFIFNKLITGGWRVEVSRKLMVKALAKFSGIDEQLIAHRLTRSWAPDTTKFKELIFTWNPLDDSSKPYPFFLACALEGTPEELGKPEEWMAERKWDGIRGQIILRGGAIFVWSRAEELITDKFPEFLLLKDLLPDGTVIDGEIIPFREGTILPFQKLQTRIRRKNISKKLLNEVPVAIIAYDLLEFNGKDFRKETQLKRREKLEEILSAVEENNIIMLSEVLDFQSWDQLHKERMNSRLFSSEGLMLKRKSSEYQVGRKKGDWWKWKAEPFTIDAVMIYAMRGNEGRSNLYTEYTFAVWKGDQLIPFAKACSGLKDSEFHEITSFVKENTIERFGPVRSVNPELVFEIAFDGIQVSSRHKSGLTLRFPRIMRWRKDMEATEANSIEDLRKMLNQYG